MSERTQTSVYIPAKIKLMEDALELAWLKSRSSRADETAVRAVLTKAIIEQVNAGRWNRDKIVANALTALGNSRKMPS
jgi:hypothetical protein